MLLYLAPMEGITTYIFRNAFEKYYGGVDKYFTPFLTASHLKGRELRDVHPENNKVPSLVPQILTNDSELFIMIALQLAELGYREVNLNLGCPSGTVTSKGRGAGFLDRTDELDRFLYEIYDGLAGKVSLAGSKPDLKKSDDIDRMKISIKTRLGMEFLSEWDDILEIYKKYPISELIVHPRLRNEFYSGEVHLDQFKKSLDAVFSETLICYNGDITSLETFDNIYRVTKSGFLNRNQEGLYMIGRGALMNPELPARIKKHYEQGSENETASDEKSLIYPELETFRHFINEIMEAYITEMSNEKQVVMKMKELWSYFAQGLGLEKKQLREIHKVNRLNEYKSAVQMILTQL